MICLRIAEISFTFTLLNLSVVFQQKPVEYAQLNHDGNHQPDNSRVVDQSLKRENITDSENNTDVYTGDPEEGTCDPAPDC